MCIMKDIKHPYIVQFFGITIDTDKAVMSVSQIKQKIHFVVQIKN